MKRQVIRIEEPAKEKQSKDIEFTHYLDTDDGFEKTEDIPSKFEKIVYLGNCTVDGHLFSAYDGEYIRIYKGHLNDGTY